MIIWGIKINMSMIPQRQALFQHTNLCVSTVRAMKHHGWRRWGGEAMGRGMAERCRCRVASNNTNLRRWERRRRRVCQQTATSRKGEQKAQLPSPIPTVSSNTGPVRFLPAEKPRWSMDHKYEAGGKGVVHFHGIFCQHNIMIGM